MARRQIAAVAVVLLAIGQLAAFAHVAATRHVTCEHGEQLDAAVLVGAKHSCDHAHWLAVKRSGGAHDECEIARALHQSSTPGCVVAMAATFFTSLAATADPATATHHPELRLYLIAPKTSPPRPTLSHPS